MNKYRITFQVDDGPITTVGGQIARTIKTLVENGPNGTTSLDIADTWALRASHYIWVLRHEHGMEIDMVREPHEGPAGSGWHGRYILKTPVRLIDDEQEAA